MKRDSMEDVLRRALGSQTTPRRLEQTAALCAALVRQRAPREEPRMGFWDFLADIFRFEGVPILACQAAALALAGLHVYGAAEHLETVPAYIPLFALAAVPALFRGRYRGVSELEAATRASTAQLTLAKLVLAGGADLVCMTLLLALQAHLTGSCRQMGRMILYCLVPYLAGMTVLLCLIRRRSEGGMPLGAAAALGSCLFWYGTGKACPWLYEIPAVGVWAAAFILFTAFFIREIYFIIRANREGKMYGTYA